MAEIFVFKIYGKLLPFFRKLYRPDRLRIRIGKLSGNFVYFKFSYLLSAYRSARPESKLFGSGKIIAAFLFSPVVGRLLPVNARSAGSLRHFCAVSDLYARISASGFFRIGKD